VEWEEWEEWILTLHNYLACSSEEEAWAAWEAWEAWMTHSVACLVQEAAAEEVDHVVVLNSLEDSLEVSLLPRDQEDLVVSQVPQAEEEVVAATLSLVSVCE
jgi:hypothetical protein